MKTTLYWILAVLITLSAAYYQRKTGPTYPKQVDVTINGEVYTLRLVRSIEIGSRSAVKLSVSDTSVSALLHYKRFNTDDEYSTSAFEYASYPIDSWMMNSIFKMTEESGLFAAIPEQPAAGKLQYWFEVTDETGTNSYFREEPVVIRYKGAVPSSVLTPHILLMFIAMLLSTLAGLMAIGKHKSYKKYGVLTLIFLLAGGMILGPVVQKYAFGELWTGIPFGWDLTDNKTLIAVIFWVWAVVANRKAEKPLLTAIAALMLLLVYSIPHSMFGSELNYESGDIVQGIIHSFIF